MQSILPDNIALTVGTKTPDEVSQVLAGDKNTLADNLALLGRYYKIKIWFTEPVLVYYAGQWKTIVEGDRTTKTRKLQKEITEHVFNGFFIGENTCRLCYKKKTNGRYGHPVDFLDKIKKWELVLDNKAIDKFNDYDAFLRRFDLQFITEAEVKKLWNSKSNQHGGQYRPSDFRQMGPQGKKVMQRFLNTFTHIDNPDTTKYHVTKDGTNYTEYYRTHHHSGRDISISHNAIVPYVWYSSEYQGCGNGSYGLVATKNMWLHLVDD